MAIGHSHNDDCGLVEVLCCDFETPRGYHFGCLSYRFFFGVRAGRDTCLFCLHTLSLYVGATDKSLSPPPVLENSVLCSKIGRSQLLANTTQCSYKKDGGNVPGVRMGVLGSERISELEVPLTWRAHTRASTCVQ